MNLLDLRLNLTALTSFVLASVAPLSWAYAQQIPVESFGRLPAIEQPTVSPDGEHVAAVLNSANGPLIAVGEFGSRDLKVVLQLKNAEDRVEWILWANNDRLLVSASYSEAFQGDRVRVKQLFSIDRSGENLKEIVWKSAVEAPLWTRIIDSDGLLSTLPDEPKYILMQIYDDRDEAFAVFKVDIYKNKFKKQFSNTYEVNSWFADRDGQVKFGIGYDEDVITTWYRESNDDGFQKMHSQKFFEGETFAPISVDGDKAYVLTDHELRRAAIWKYDIPSAQYEELVYAVDGYSVDDAILDEDRSTIIGAEYTEHYQKRHYFNDDGANVYQKVANAFPGFQTNIVSRSSDWNRLIVLTIRDNAPITYYWLDLSKGAGGAWFAQYPELQGAALTSVMPFDFKARDGMKLNGYLTVPSFQGDKKPPLIIFPHGGPQSRDTQYFDPFVQFFASRGYAVLQVNFRGSEGFNSNFEVAGYREWGGKMQEDVYDAIEWLEGLAMVDTSRACMVGASYGGYVALTAAYQQPDRYKCIVSIAGVSDIYSMVDENKLFESSKITYRKLVGDPTNDEDRKMLIRNSPVNHVDSMKAPILLIHGDHDTQVRVAQSREFYRRARKAKLDVEYIEIHDGTHYLDNQDNRIMVFETIDKFLRTHL